MGPYASEGALRHHLRNAHATVHWAVNGYLREAVLARADADDAAADFEPAAHAAGRDRARPGDEPQIQAAADVAVPALPPALWELILQRLSAPDVRAAAAVCVALRAAANSQVRP